MEEQEDFDNLYSSKLPNFAGNDWRALEGQLERHDLKRQLTRLMWALPAVGGIMLTVSSILYYQLNRTREQVKTLENRLVSAYQKIKVQPEISPQKVFLHDTVYRQVIVKQIVRVPFSNNLSNNQDNIYYEKYGENSTENQIITEREKYVGIHKLSGKEPVLSASNIKISNDFSKYKGEAFPEDSSITESHFSLIPKSVSIGLVGGIQKPLGDDFENSGGNEIGLRTVFGYHNSKGQERWGVVLDLQQSNLFFDNKKFDINKRERFEQLMGTPPTPRPNGTIPQLDRVEVRKSSSYKVGLGLRYNLLFSEKFKPYFGANWAIQIHNNDDIYYHYEDQSKPIISRAATIQMFGINAGANIFLTNRLAMNAEAYLQSQLNNTDLFDTPLILGGRVGVSYRFGN